LLKGKAVHAWMVAQWITSGILWCIWIMQDAANIAVYLPRSLNLNEFLFFAGFIFFGLAIIFYLRGDKIQQVINEKTKVSDVRAATMIDLVYAIILIIFQWISTIPMSTTWVFLGLLAGRELGITIAERKNRFPRTLQLIRKDLVHAVIGLIISIIIALLVNPHVQKELSVIINYFMQTIEIFSN
jgi:phosphate/sulfate permease